VWGVVHWRRLQEASLVSENQRAISDELVQQRGGVPASGPASVMLNTPEVAKRALGLALYLRTETSLAPRIRELGMLVAARENDCQFIWHAHAPLARMAGLKDDIVDALRDKKELSGLTPDEASVVNYGREFIRTRRVSLYGDIWAPRHRCAVIGGKR